jgi:predicted transcriptional regulator
MTTTTIRLPDDLQARVAEAARQMGTLAVPEIQQAVNTVTQHQQAGHDAHRACLGEAAKTRQQQSRQQQVRQGTQAEGQHQHRPLAGRTARQRSGERAIDEAAGQPTPQQAEREGLRDTAYRQESRRERLDTLPHALPAALQPGQGLRQAEQVDAHGDQHQLGEQIEPGLQTAQAADRLSEQPGDKARGGVTGDAAEVVGEMDRDRRCTLRALHAQCADDAAAHAGAMAAAEQSNNEQREERVIHSLIAVLPTPTFQMTLE